MISSFPPDIDRKEFLSWLGSDPAKTLNWKVLFDSTQDLAQIPELALIIEKRVAEFRAAMLREASTGQS